ncbi:MAG: MotA/TolQ/ExbB proton channel family protein [Bacteriovoracales bacterium]|nr:MotA/TolQ/ExbB proton channel family protein [Bacteriovoracales bacterium]
MFIVNAFEQGGIFMYFILVFFVLTLAFIAERALALYVHFKETPNDFRENLLECLRNGNFESAKTLASKHSDAAMGRIATLGFALRSEAASDEELQARMDERLSKELGEIDRRTSFLAMYGNVATLVGLLGTIGGMVIAFAGVADANPADRAALLSQGISHALNCTAFGLLVAIPALVFYAVFQNRTDAITRKITHGTTQLYHDLLFYTGVESLSEKRPKYGAAQRC